MSPPRKISDGAKLNRASGSRSGARERVTERENPASADLERKSVVEILKLINREDQRVPRAVVKVIPAIARAVELASEHMARGGRMIYLGAGTSGRLGVLDAAECLPTFNTDRIQAVLAGGRRAMFAPVEKAEDSPSLARRDLRRMRVSKADVVVGISASGQTPYTLAGVRYARRLGAKTVAITCNPAAALRRAADIAIVPVVGPEVIAGSSRMKAGTAQKLVLNMLSTATMTRRGHVFSGWMINLRATNRKLRERATRILMRAAGVEARSAARALRRSGGDLPAALLMLTQHLSPQNAKRLLRQADSPASVIGAVLERGAEPRRENSKRTRKARISAGRGESNRL